MTDTTDISELNALYRAGILTEDEHAEAQRKLQARVVPPAPKPARHSAPEPTVAPQPELVLQLTPDDSDTAEHLPAGPRPAGHAVGHASRSHTGGRHSRPASPKWPWIVVAVLAVIAAATVSIALLRPTHHGAAPPKADASQTTTQAPAIVVGSGVNSPVTINLDGANAQITVSALTAVPAAAKTAKTITYVAMVTAVAATGSFQLQPSNFSAQASSGHMYATTAAPKDAMVPGFVLAGHQSQGEIAFTVPKTDHIAAILFTTSLGEQLGVWTTSGGH